MQYDLLIIGGGITGAGILLEASKRGLKALLVEQRDFAWGTSSRSSKMVHGGLRYLASGDIKLTRDAVHERRRLLKEAPGLVDNLHFFMPHYQGGFPGPWLFDKVMKVYDAMAGQQNHEFYSASQTSRWASGMQQTNLKGATRFADAIVDDARLVLRVLSEAKSFGGEAKNYHQATELLKNDQGKVVGAKITNVETRQSEDIHAKVVVNAAGAWTDKLRSQLDANSVIRPLRGSHLFVPFWRLPVACAVSFAHPKDKRPVFIFPWEGITVIGTTDLDHNSDLNAEASISNEEISYLIDSVNYIFPTSQLNINDVQASIAGVRPVVAGSQSDPSKEKRDHVIWDDNGLISVAGGKLTTFRLIALDVLAKTKPYLPQAGKYASEEIFSSLNVSRPTHINAWQWRRLTGRFGNQATRLSQLDLTRIAHTQTTWAELQWACKYEQVVHLDDLLLRRTRLGLLLPNGAVELEEKLQQKLQPTLGWNNEQWHSEWQRYLTIWQQYYAPHKETL